jgi:hypothetical protein
MAIKAKVAGYQQISRRRNPQQVGSPYRNSLGKGEVESSILSCSTTASPSDRNQLLHIDRFPALSRKKSLAPLFQ